MRPRHGTRLSVDIIYVKAAPHPATAATQELKLMGGVMHINVLKAMPRVCVGQLSFRGGFALTILLNVVEDLRPHRCEVSHVRVFIDHWKSVEGEHVGAPVTQPVQRVCYILISLGIAYSV